MTRAFQPVVPTPQPIKAVLNFPGEKCAFGGWFGPRAGKPVSLCLFWTVAASYDGGWERGEFGADDFGAEGVAFVGG